MFTGMDDEKPRPRHFWDDDKQEVEAWIEGRGSVVMAVFAAAIVLGLVWMFLTDLL